LQETRLTEVQPGLIFSDDGEALDLQGKVATYRNIELVKQQPRSRRGTAI